MDHTECRVCGDLIPHAYSSRPENKAFPVCATADCQHVARQRSTMTPSAFEHHLRFRRRIIGDRRAVLAARRKLAEEVLARKLAENQAILREVLNQNAELREDSVDLLEIPSGHQETSTLSEDRIRNFRQHLQKTIAAAARYADAAQVKADEKALEQLQHSETRFSKNSELRVISDRLCSMCKGGCCTAGGDTAYISTYTIRRFMDANPDLSVAEILETYLSRLSVETVTSACINQTSTGCGLPREMRSETCNGYYCDSLRLWHERPDETRNDTVLAVQRSHSNWRRINVGDSNRVVDVALVHLGGTVKQSCSIAQPETSGTTPDVEWTVGRNGDVDVD